MTKDSFFCDSLLDSLNRLRHYAEKRDFAGFDPYDALNSPSLRFLSSGSKFARLIAIQALKKFPVNLRPLLGIHQGHNPKGLGLFLWGYVKLYLQEKDPTHLRKIAYLLDLLEGCKTLTPSGHGWGYNFDWQSREFFLPQFTPTIVNSAFVGHALLDACAHLGSERALRLALPIADFISKDLNRLEEDGTLCFSYSPLDRYFVHNANLLGASFLIRLYRYRQDAEMLELALKSLAYAMKHLREDGFWFYAEKESAHWIDSFHTGFNLMAIRYFLDSGYGNGYNEQFNKAVQFYASNFFLADGTPKYYHDRLYPIDIHCPAMAVIFFSPLKLPYRELAQSVCAWMIRNMQDPEGFFYYRKSRHLVNRIPYMRWGQAWAFLALATARQPA